MPCILDEIRKQIKEKDVGKLTIIKTPTSDDNIFGGLWENWQEKKEDERGSQWEKK
jgi:hypothetical protein